MSTTTYIHNFEVLRTLRLLLRHTNNATRTTPSSKLWRQHIMSLYRKNKNLTDEDQMQHFRQQGADACLLFSQVQSLKAMQSTWKGSEARMKESERVSRVANHVGFRLPEPKMEEPLVDPVVGWPKHTN